MDMNVTGGEPISVAESVFDAPFKQDLVHQVVRAYQAGARQGTKAQKTRAEVNATTKKSKRQKGGGARHGALSAPIFVGGGVTFAAKPRSFKQKVNRKMYRGALRSILSELTRAERLKVIQDIEPADGKTRTFAEQLKALEVEGRVLVVATEVSTQLHRASRNLPLVTVIDVAALNPVDAVKADHVLLTTDAVRKIEEWLA